ncbi:ABC transporter permease [Edaphobacter sp. HDX4]|uniref:ABC transporter permease n=1 Tax=Edaphobacter sp. HDX4 TaxID=2794064 RepID=UPI002FE57277
MQSIPQDLRYGFRQLRKSPGFAITAILTLALGIGATTALFSIVDGVLLKPLAYRDSGRLVAVWERVRFLEKLFPYTGPNPRHIDLWQRRASAFSDMTVLQANSVGVSRESGDHPALVGRVNGQANLLDVLGIQPILGRNFLPQETTEGHQNVVLISWRIWQNLFHGDRNVIGRTINVAGTPHEIIGVLPQSFYFPKANELASSPIARQLPEIEVISPLVLNPLHNFGWMSDFGNLVVLGHVKPGVSLAQAQEQLNVIADDIVRQVPPNQLDGDPHGALSAYVQPLKDAIVGKTATRLWLLFAAVASVLLIACVNLANVQLARFAGRDREAAVRSALGASSARLIQSALAEASLLSVTGGLLGIALAFAAVHWFSRYAQLAIPRTGAITISLTVLSLSVALTVGASLIFGVLPALRLLRVRPQQVLHGMGRTTASAWTNILRRWLIGAQVFLCVTLLLVAGLFARSLARLSTFDKGFSTDHVVAADVFLQGKAFNEASRASFADGVLAKLRSLPGVQSASVASAMLLEGETWIDGVSPTDQAEQQHALANYRWISPGYFATLQQKIISGRALNDSDRGTRNAVISEATARAVWPGREPVGRQFKRNGNLSTVVGVVADAHNNSLREAPVNMVYLPFWDAPPRAAYFLVRGSQDPSQLIETVRSTIWNYNPDVTIARVHTLDSQVSDSIAPEHLETSILLAFGGAALLLALLGIYGTLSYVVQTRTQEVGIRIALGASRQSVYWLMTETILPPVLLALLAGWAASLGIGRTLSALLYDTAPTDPVVSISVVLLFAIAAAAATFVPCRHAAHIDPIQALRAE